MNVALVAMLGFGLAQPPAAASDYHPFNSRNIKFPIQFAPDKVKSIRKVELHVSNDGGQVWQLAAVAPPTQDTFAYTAPADGRYWFQIVTEDLKGTRDPANLTTEAPAMKVLFDTKPPIVTFTNAKRTGDEVVIEWRIDDQFPKDEATKVYFRPANATDGWQEVTLPAGSKNGVRFSPGVAGPIAVRVAVADLVGNKGEGVKEIEGGAATVSFSPGATAATPTISLPSMAVPASGTIPPPDLGPLAPSIPMTPPAVVPAVPPTVPSTPSVPAPMTATPPAPAALPMTPPSMPAAPSTPSALPTGPSTPPSVPAPVPTFDPRGGVTPTAGASSPLVDAPKAQVLNSLRFDLNYQVEQRGPSGISRVDLWVTRDDGKTWVWWSKHDGREAAVKVNLDPVQADQRIAASNWQAEGLYGFRLVPVSGAGLSDATPASGDSPDLRVVVDTTAPVVKIFPAAADPNSVDSLVLQWEATDKNFGEDPITLEWCEGPNGPWRPVATAASSELPGSLGVVSKRLPNTGKYSWRVPTGLPPRVYLKVTAKDAAGNTTEQVTREPILVDLTKPRAKITGIGATPLVRP
jgi:hypothetical protein